MSSESSKLRCSSPSQTTAKIKAIGLCLGASTVSVVQVEQDINKKDGNPIKALGKPRVVSHALYPHEGDPKKTLLSALKPIDLDSCDKIGATGRRFRNFVNLSSIPEPEAVEYAYQFVKSPHISSPAVISAGGETFMVYVLDRFGRISNVLTGNKCASGTGEFFLQQLRRMNVSLDEAAQWAVSTEPHHVSGRCSVFCKSDCTHATNKGIPKARVTAGLCRMMANKILELLKKIERNNIMLVGGTARNQMMVECLHQEIPGLIVPQEAPYFEALGAALWALENETIKFPGMSQLLHAKVSAFDTLLPLVDFKDMVEFKTVHKGAVRSGDRCVLGLDVGSTTTKAVLMRKSDNSMLASIYLLTNGDPVGASRQCYQAILDQVKAKVNPSEISIVGLGVCGSGRQIAGLHALTDGVINEIIAHASAAVHFDPDVDTIFEIGGQDAKYTYITNGVPSDYAMNEACSAGTGSFLEESAFETLGVRMEDIADIAFQGMNPPNFNDQCAAFIASDIKNAIHEGVEHQDIVAGLVYSICMNYANRVKGNRPVGDKVFMQGGVCYNRAVPFAMAALVGKPIIVPPEPGLMGAYGVALEVKKRIDEGLMAEDHFDLQRLVNRDVSYAKSFTCKGGKEKCDRRCNIAIIELEGKKYPFGGACNRYYNLRHNLDYDVEHLDLVRVRQQLIFEKYGAKLVTDPGQNLPKHSRTKANRRIGINRSFMVNTYYPLYSNFFVELGFEPVVPDTPSQEGIDRKNASFCFPAEQAHGFFYSLLQMENPPQFIFLPHFKAVPGLDGKTSSQVCPFVQGETFFLQATFKEKLRELKKQGVQVLAPLLDLTHGLETAAKPLVETAIEMGVSRKAAEKAFKKALAKQEECLAEMTRLGKKALEKLEEDPAQTAVVIFGRAYNGFVDEAHMGIPHKIASRGIPVIPYDFLMYDDKRAKRHMYWGMGQRIIKASRFVEEHPQLFGTFITNFSCGPDSFIIGYFRDIMGRKPSLTLELDSHTADAGLETRIEAFLDIVSAYRQLIAEKKIVHSETPFVPARTMLDHNGAKVVTSAGKILSMTDPKVKLLLPSMGDTSSQSLAAVFRSFGFNMIAHPPSDEAVLKLGRANSSCKECLPLILTTGTLINYIDKHKRDGEVLIYFMPTASGPCRFGQYHVYMEDMIKKRRIPDVAMLSLTSENGYVGLGNQFVRRVWRAVVVSDVIEDLRSMILANAVDVEAAMKIFHREWGLIIAAMEKGEAFLLEKQLAVTAEIFSRIPMKRSMQEVPTISLVGEIFVRRDSLSRQNLTERLAQKGFATRCSPVAEWLLYSDYLVRQGLVDYKMTKVDKLEFFLRKKYMSRYERRIKSILARSGLIHPEPIIIQSIIDNAVKYISPNLTGEAILTVGSALSEVVSHTCGVIAIGPFGCMPNRLSEAILTEAMSRETKLATDPDNRRLRSMLSNIESLPFLAIESDGSPFPQLISAKLETFCLRAERLHQTMLSVMNNRRAN